MAILRRNCPHCPAEHVGFDVKWNEHPPYSPGNFWNCVAICGACGKPICFVAIAKQPNNTNPPSGHHGEIESKVANHGWLVPEIWPSRMSPAAPPYTPRTVEKRFMEGEDAFRRGNWNSAIAMYRSALDIATKGMEGVPQGVTFFQRLEWLHANHRITPDIRSWAHHVRVEGNAALHDPEEFDATDAKVLRFFTEMFLRYVFELPGAVAAFRKPEDSTAAAETP
jgi:hypothetical protein